MLHVKLTYSSRHFAFEVCLDGTDEPGCTESVQRACPNVTQIKRPGLKIHHCRVQDLLLSSGSSCQKKWRHGTCDTYGATSHMAGCAFANRTDTCTQHIGKAYLGPFLQLVNQLSPQARSTCSTRGMKLHRSNDDAVDLLKPQSLSAEQVGSCSLY